MKKILLLIPSFIFISFSLFAQYKIVFDFTKADTINFSTIVRHATNLMNMEGNAKLEIVCHGPGLDLLIKDKTTVQKEIEELQSKFNVIFVACEATMRRRGIDKGQLLPKTVTVSAANLELALKQQQGWSYIKAGY